MGYPQQSQLSNWANALFVAFQMRHFIRWQVGTARKLSNAQK